MARSFADAFLQLGMHTTTARAATAERTYVFRDLPYSVVPYSELWCITGSDMETSNVGVLEYCVNRDDAQSLRIAMSKYRRFVNLSVTRYADVYPPQETENAR